MTSEELRNNDYFTVNNFMDGQHKHQNGFAVSLRMTAQKPAIQAIFADDFERHSGFEEVRSAILHSLRIKIQSFVKTQAHKLTGVSSKRNTIEAFDMLDDEMVKEIQEACLDWQYGARLAEDSLTKKALMLADMLETDLTEDFKNEIRRDPQGYINEIKARTSN